MTSGASARARSAEKKLRRPASRSTRSWSVAWRRGSVVVAGSGFEVSVMSLSFRRLLAEEAAGTEHEDGDQDPEHDRARPVAARREPVEALVELLDEADEDPAEDGPREAAAASAHGGGE